MRQFLRYQNARDWEEIRHILRILMSAFALWVAVWMVSRTIVGDSWRTIRMGNFLTVWMVLALLVAVIVALWLQHRWLTIGLVFLLSVSVYQNQLWAVAVAEPLVLEPEEDDLRIMTFNVHPTNVQIDRVADLILANDLDIVALQEISEEAKDELLSAVADEYSDVVLDEQLVLLSRYPLEALPVDEDLMQSQLVRLSLPAEDILVWNVHAPTAVKQSIWQAQKRDLLIIEESLKETDAPLILMGDLNTTDQSENYQYIANHLVDSHVVAGQGLGLTYPEPDVVYTLMPSLDARLQWVPPMLRIDYIFVSPDWQVKVAEVVADGYGSDHRPVMATINLR